MSKDQHFDALEEIKGPSQKHMQENIARLQLRNHQIAAQIMVLRGMRR